MRSFVLKQATKHLRMSSRIKRTASDQMPHYERFELSKYRDDSKPTTYRGRSCRLSSRSEHHNVSGLQATGLRTSILFGIRSWTTTKVVKEAGLPPWQTNHERRVKTGDIRLLQNDFIANGLPETCNAHQQKHYRVRAEPRHKPSRRRLECQAAGARHSVLPAMTTIVADAAGRYR